MYIKPSIFLCVNLIVISAANKNNMFDLFEYYKLPPLYTEEDYHRCLLQSKTNESVYCSVVTTIKPDNSSEVWKLIEEYSRDKIKHFRHDITFHGICVSWCKDKLMSMEYNEYLFENIFDIDHEYYNTVYKNAFRDNEEIQNMRSKYDRILNKCVNMYLLKEFNLKGYSTVISCSSNNKSEQKNNMITEFLNNVFIGLLLVISSLVFTGTYYHFHYVQIVTKPSYSPIQELIMQIFSLQINYNRLISSPISELGRDLRYLQAARYIFIFFIIFGHLTYLYTRVPILNPQYFEQKYYSLWGMLQLNGSHIVQTFFLISGLLMGLAFKDIIDKKNFSLSYSWIAMAYRFIRLTPVYGIVLFYETTSLMRPSTLHPFWQERFKVERNQCQLNWWLNILYLNNVFNIPTTCMPHSWYLAADFQVFLFSLVFMMLSWRFKNFKFIILTLGGLIVLLFPAVITYLKEYPAIYMASPEDYKYHLLQDAFQHYYIPFYTNAGNYYFAMILGLHYDLLKNEKIVKLFKIPAQLVFYLIFPFGMVPFLSSYIFYNFDIDKSAWWITVWTTISKHFWGFLGLTIVFVFANNLDQKHFFPALIRKVLLLSIWQPLGRLTYCIYLVHLAIERFIVSDRGLMLYLTDSTIILSAITSLFFSTLVALYLCLFIEFPTSAIIKIIMNKTKQKRIANESVENLPLQ